jgi:hypothetical protein
MKKEFLEIAQRALAEGWDSFKIMAEFINVQKEIDAKLAEANNYPELADKIRQQ